MRLGEATPAINAQQQQQLQQAALAAARFVFVNNKRNRMRWTPELHEFFLLAIAKLEDKGARVVPGHILKMMKELAGGRTQITLTRDQVASHLQKYRNDVRQAYGLDDNGNFGFLNTQRMYYDQATGNWTHSPVPNAPVISVPIESSPTQSQNCTPCPSAPGSPNYCPSVEPSSPWVPVNHASRSGFSSSASPRASPAPIPNPSISPVPSPGPLEHSQDGECSAQQQSEGSQQERTQQELKEKEKKTESKPQRPAQNALKTSVSSLATGVYPHTAFQTFDSWYSMAYESMLMDHSQDYLNMLEGAHALPFNPISASTIST